MGGTAGWVEQVINYISFHSFTVVLCFATVIAYMSRLFDLLLLLPAMCLNNFFLIRAFTTIYKQVIIY